jgi:hypothetical protein
MSMQDYDTARALVQTHWDEADFVPQPEDRVARAEQALGVVFPPTYRRFLRELGAGGVGGEEVYGLVNDDFTDDRPPQAVGLTRAFREQGQIADGLVVVHALGQGTYHALDTTRANADGEAPVVAFTPGLSTAGGDHERVADDFGSFFLDLVRADLAD